MTLLSKVLGLMLNKREISGPGGRAARITAKLDAIASRRAAELPAPSERPIPLERVGDVYSAVPARLHGDGPIWPKWTPSSTKS